MRVKREPVSTPRTLAVLCVDDHASGLAIRKAVLESFGYSVHTATSGVEALEIAARTTLDAIVLDYRMPEMNGLELARALRLRLPAVPLIVLSGYAGRLPNEFTSMAAALVTKGSHPSALREALEKVLGAAPDRRKHLQTVEKTVQRARENVELTHDLLEESKKAADRSVRSLAKCRKRRA